MARFLGSIDRAYPVFEAIRVLPEGNEAVDDQRGLRARRSEQGVS